MQVICLNHKEVGFFVTISLRDLLGEGSRNLEPNSLAFGLQHTLGSLGGLVKDWCALPLEFLIQ